MPGGVSLHAVGRLWAGARDQEVYLVSPACLRAHNTHTPRPSVLGSPQGRHPGAEPGARLRLQDTVCNGDARRRHLPPALHPRGECPCVFVNWCSKPAPIYTPSALHGRCCPTVLIASASGRRSLSHWQPCATGCRLLRNVVHQAQKSLVHALCTESAESVQTILHPAPWPSAFSALGAWQSPQHHRRTIVV